MTGVQNQTRVLDTWITRQEKKILLWIAPRLPAWVVPDTLTMLGLASSVLILVAYALTFFDKNYLWLASLGFVINWFGDSLDGTLARVRHIERPRYGFFIDHIIDSVSETLVFVGLGLSPYLRFDLALIALVSYLLASIYVYLATYVNGVFRISYSGISPTEMRLIAIGANAVVFFTGNPSFTVPSFGLQAAPLAVTLFDLIMVGVILILLYLFTANTILTAQGLSREDRAAHRVQKQEARAQRVARRQALREASKQRRAASRQARAMPRPPVE